MTVNSRSLLLLLIFIESVFSIQNIFQPGFKGSSPRICSYPYSCMPTTECGERHSGQGIDEVLFQCEAEKTVCCPPVVKSSPPSSQFLPNVHPTTQGPAIGGCSRCSSEGNRPQTTAVGGNPIKQDVHSQGNGHHHLHPTTQSPAIGGCSRCSSEGGRPQTTAVGGFPIKQDVHSQGIGHHHPQVAGQNVRPLPPSSGVGRPPQAQAQPGRRTPTQQAQSQPPSLTSHRNFRLLPSESHCGVNTFANRITEGEEVSLGEYPWMVLTGLKDKFGNYRWNCGGTLINDRYVLTAAHCLIVDNRTVEYVRLGEHSLTNETDCYREVCLDPPEDIAIEEVIPHEKWNTTTIKNDIALLRLSRNPLKLGKSNIYPICLPLDPKKLNITSSTKYEVAGWGKTDWNADEGSDVLRKASLSGVNREECNICKDKKKQQYCPIIDTQLCVQGWKSVDVCKGDSGGPLMVTRLNIYQIGITSFKGSEYCGAENIPSIFTKVESFLPWILDNIRE